ncbi:hypothetical protein [Leuconostoc citreum]|uniref:hypothetical protein n=1 Tax=Leuconostoc citreum TaxID=33964 RepID=UPI0032DE55D2
MENLEITARVQDTIPLFEDGVMSLKSATVVVSFSGEQENAKTYFGGQVLLTKEEDGITFQTTQDEFLSKGIEKAKRLIAEAEPKAPYVPQAPLVEPPHTDE